MQSAGTYSSLVGKLLKKEAEVFHKAFLIILERIQKQMELYSNLVKVTYYICISPRRRKKEVLPDVLTL